LEKEAKTGNLCLLKDLENDEAALTGIHSQKLSQSERLARKQEEEMEAKKRAMEMAQRKITQERLMEDLYRSGMSPAEVEKVMSEEERRISLEKEMVREASRSLKRDQRLEELHDLKKEKRMRERDAARERLLSEERENAARALLVQKMNQVEAVLLTGSETGEGSSGRSEGWSRLGASRYVEAVRRLYEEEALAISEARQLEDERGRAAAKYRATVTKEGISLVSSTIQDQFQDNAGLSMASKWSKTIVPSEKQVKHKHQHVLKKAKAEAEAELADMAAKMSKMEEELSSVTAVGDRLRKVSQLYEEATGSEGTRRYVLLAECSRMLHEAFDCEPHNADVQYNLALCYAKGEGVLPNLQKAVELYRMASNQGHALAQLNLGVSCMLGEGTERDTFAAVELYQASAFQGNLDAESNLALCYFHGDGVTQNQYRAVALFESAASKGDVKAFYNLGVCAEAGLGMPENRALAVQFYGTAAIKGHPVARERLDCLTTVTSDRTMTMSSSLT